MATYLDVATETFQAYHRPIFTIAVLQHTARTVGNTIDLAKIRADFATVALGR